LKVQHYKLVNATFTFRGRDKQLFQVCSKALKEKNEKRAVIYANELAEVRKVTNFLKYAQIAVERVILRLETVKELHAIAMDMKPMLNALRDITAQLNDLMPDVSSELENVSESIEETLVMTTLDTPQPIAQVDLQTPAGEKILGEASDFLEQKLAKQLPEPPKQLLVPEKNKPVESRKELVALTAACSQEAQRSVESSAVISCKNMDLRELSLKVDQPSSVEEILLDYIKARKGRINVSECALELNSSVKEIKRALENLSAKGRIKIKS
jgi:division protein CdvB (Snf7/Vps24/ESCRT-III family)